LSQSRPAKPFAARVRLASEEDVLAHWT
jgi:hypothetical protein